MTPSSLISHEPEGTIKVHQKGPAPWLENIVGQALGLRALPPNWDDEGAEPISNQVIVHALLFLNEVMTPEINVPHLVPTPTGGVQLEWVRADVLIEVQIEAGRVSEILVRTEDGLDAGESSATLIDAVRRGLRNHFLVRNRHEAFQLV